MRCSKKIQYFRETAKWAKIHIAKRVAELMTIAFPEMGMYPSARLMLRQGTLFREWLASKHMDLRGRTPPGTSIGPLSLPACSRPMPQVSLSPSLSQPSFRVTWAGFRVTRAGFRVTYIVRVTNISEAHLSGAARDTEGPDGGGESGVLYFCSTDFRPGRDPGAADRRPGFATCKGDAGRVKARPTQPPRREKLKGWVALGVRSFIILSYGRAPRQQTAAGRRPGRSGVQRGRRARESEAHLSGPGPALPG